MIDNNENRKSIDRISHESNNKKEQTISKTILNNRTLGNKTEFPSEDEGTGEDNAERTLKARRIPMMPMSKPT